MTFVLSPFSKEIFDSRYAFPNETWDGACVRVARQIASAELPEKQSTYQDKFYNVLVNNYFVPGGRILHNAGRPSPQMLNCFVLNPNKDSKEGWGNSAKDMIITSMTGGGCGDDFSDVRPKGASITGQKGESPGPVELMRLIDACAKPVRAGGQRRVALMFSLDLDHPDIHEFLDAKLIKGELTYANVSVRSKNTTDFIKAIKEDGLIELNWKGKYKKQVSARELWNKIVTNAYNSAEPGFLNWELVLSESTIYYIEDLVTTNPCGEQALSAYDCCDLGHLVLPRFVINGKVDHTLLADTIRVAVRFLDNVLSVNHFPLPEMKDKANKLRRIGLGITGLADMLTMLDLSYGSEAANKEVDRLMRFISKQAYEASILLAIEKGPFPLCNPEKHVKSGYISRMTDKVKQLIKEHGIRNCAILTVAPTGTVSILSNNCSSGIEPMFSAAYERRYWDKDTRKTELVFHPLFKQYMLEGKDVSHFKASHELTAREHMEVQRIVQKHVDSAVSKTINLLESYSMEEMSEIWLEYLPFLKGTTFYRQNTRGYVDEKGVVHEPPLVVLSLEKAKELFNTDVKEGSEVDCNSGVCDI